MKIMMIVVVVLLLGGCVSGKVDTKMCGDLTKVKGVLNSVGANWNVLDQVLIKKCAGVGVSGDTGKLTGGVSAGISNE